MDAYEKVTVSRYPSNPGNCTYIRGEALGDGACLFRSLAIILGKHYIDLELGKGMRFFINDDITKFCYEISNGREHLRNILYLYDEVYQSIITYPEDVVVSISDYLSTIVSVWLKFFIFINTYTRINTFMFSWNFEGKELNNRWNEIKNEDDSIESIPSMAAVLLFCKHVEQSAAKKNMIECSAGYLQQRMRPFLRIPYKFVADHFDDFQVTEKIYNSKFQNLSGYGINHEDRINHGAFITSETVEQYTSHNKEKVFLRQFLNPVEWGLDTSISAFQIILNNGLFPFHKKIDKKYGIKILSPYRNTKKQNIENCFVELIDTKGISNHQDFFYLYHDGNHFEPVFYATPKHSSFLTVIDETSFLHSNDLT